MILLAYYVSIASFIHVVLFLKLSFITMNITQVKSFYKIQYRTCNYCYGLWSVKSSESSNTRKPSLFNYLKEKKTLDRNSHTIVDSSVTPKKVVKNDKSITPDSFNKKQKNQVSVSESVKQLKQTPSSHLVVTNQPINKGKVDNNEVADDNQHNPWKELFKKIDKTEPSKQSIGKVIREEKEQMNDELQCKHFEMCGGCSTKGNFKNIPTVSKAQAFFTSENMKGFPIHIFNHTDWRTHVKLAVQPLSKWGGLKIGLYKPGTHTVEPIPDCKVHHPRINEAVEVLKVEASQLGVKGFEQSLDNKLQTNNGDLRYIQLSVERSTGKVQLVLVWNCATYKEADQSLSRLVKKLKSRYDLFHSISVNFQTSRGNSIFNYNLKAWKLLWGSPMLSEKIGEANFFFRPQIFRQANLDAFETGIIPAVAKHVPQNSVVAELYSGIGTIGLNVVSRSKEVFCSDSNEFVDDVFDKCVETLPEEYQDNIFYENLPAEDAIVAGQCDEVDVMIVDPPRRGLDAGVLNLLVDKHETAIANSKSQLILIFVIIINSLFVIDLKRLIYVSCGYDALEKDVRTLLESGKWKLRSVEGFVLFPGSDHLETVVALDRIGRTWVTQ